MSNIQLRFEDLKKNSAQNVDVSLQNLTALKELLRFRPHCSDTNSVFGNPLLLACIHENIKCNALAEFLKWEDLERFRQLFVDVPVSNVLHSHLLPIFASRILIDKEKLAYKSPTLERNGIVRTCQQKLLGTLSLEMTCTRQKYSPELMSKNLIEDFCKLLQTWKSLFAENPQTNSHFENWIQRLFNTQQMDVKDRKLGSLCMIEIGMIMIEAASFMMEVSSYLPAVDPVVEKQVSASYLYDQVCLFFLICLIR